MSNAVRLQSKAVQAMAGDWALLDGLIGGTRAMRAAGKALLPQFPAEDDQSYSARLKTAVLTNFFGRTSSIMASKPFSQEINLAGLSAPIVELLGDVDGQGSELQEFGVSLLRACMSHGVAGVLVDCPPAQGLRTKADEQAAQIRPYWCMYPAATILGGKAVRVGGQWVLTQVRLLENVTEEDGEFGEKAVEQVRVLTPGAWAIWRKPGNADWAVHDGGLTSIKEVPFQFFYGTRTGFGSGVSPLLDLAYLNCEHWQSRSDQQNILHVARVPILFGKGFIEGTKLTVGASNAVLTSDPASDLKFVEHNGHAIEAGRQDILDLEDRMRQLGAELLVKHRANVTATQVVNDGSSSKCILQSIVETFEDGLNACIATTAKWIGADAGGEIELFKDFGVDSLSDASAALLLDAANVGLISDETFFEEMRRRTIIDSDRQWKDEQAKIKASPPRTPVTMPPEPVHPGKAD